VTPSLGASRGRPARPGPHPVRPAPQPPRATPTH